MVFYFLFGTTGTSVKKKTAKKNQKKKMCMSNDDDNDQEVSYHYKPQYVSFYSMTSQKYINNALLS